MNLIECDNLCMNYEGVCALNCISFTAAEGDFISVVGENGSGKSTLVKGILGLKQYSSGTIKLNAMKQTEIGYLPQQADHQRDFPATVSEVVLSGCLNRTGLRPFYNKVEKAKADGAIKSMKLDSVKRRSYRELSGGQQQRVLLARALCATEKLLLLDEPTTGLDPVTTSELYNLIHELNKEKGVTVLMVSHDMDGATKYANKILHINSGGSFFGTTDEYKNTAFFNKMHKGENADDRIN